MLQSLFKNSKTEKVLRFLFADNLSFGFSETFTGKILSKASFPKISLALALTSAFLLWYESLLDVKLPILGNDLLPPLLLAGAFLFADKAGFRIRKYHIWYVGFLLVVAFSGILGAFAGFGKLEIFLGLMIYLQFLIALIAGENFKEHPGDILTVGSLPLLLVGLWEFITKSGGTRYSYLETAGNRVDSFIGNPNIFGFILVLLTLYIVSGFLTAKTRVKKFLYAGYAAVSLFLIFASGSRTALLALFGGIVIYIAVKNLKQLILLPLILIALLVPRIRERFSGIFSSQYLADSAIDGRVWSLKNAFEIFRKNPFGTGPGTYGGRFAQQYSSPVYYQGLQKGYPALMTTDNQYLALLVQSGLFGVLWFVGFFASLFSAVWGKFLGTTLLVSFIIMMLFSNAFEFGAVVVPFALLLGYSLANEVK